ncbi:uncharacterized protein LOC113773058 [Coffea eugenioides]|uniref:uncharacterized protein LOC113773058 n=1 Tax=Coffea eugenioides TaxID=49369 RepID=UPI000F61523A|nr:uncharacterized protein LOC113773058 [Coffea eugenioides]
MSKPSPDIEFDDLEQLSLIGEGDGGSKVFEVVHHPTGNLYALKQLGKSRLQDFYSKERIHHEINILKHLDHPNLIKFYQFFDQDENFLLLLEYLNCKSLEGSHITNESTLSDIASQVLSSLAYLHRRKLLHRNIRPSKIFMNSQKGIKISFLGQTFSFLGGFSMAAYTSPENLDLDLNQRMDNGYSGDVWSLGITILELYLGSFPFNCGRKSDWEILKQTIWHEQPPEASPTASPEFADFISCCLKKDQGKRWTVEQLLGHPFIFLRKIGSRKIQGFLDASNLAFSDSRDHTSAALSIQKTYRGWKGHKDFLARRQKVIKIQAYVRGYQVRKIYKVYSVASFPEESGIRWHQGGLGLRGFGREKECVNEIEREQVQKLSHRLKFEQARNEAGYRVASVGDFPDEHEQHQGNFKDYGESTVPSVPSFGSPISSSTTWTLTQEKLLESALQLFSEDCPNRWEKVAAVVGGGMSADDVKNHPKVLVTGYQISKPKQAVLTSRYALKHRRSKVPTTLIHVSPEEFRATVMKWTESRNQQTSEIAKAKESPLEPFEPGSKDKRTYCTGGKKESNKIATNLDAEFENLPEYVRRCVTYCTLFPLGYEFEKDTLVQLWIAEELIVAKAKEKLENQGGICFDILVYKEYIVPSRFNKLYRQQKYKVNESKCSMWYFQQGFSEESYVRFEEGKLKDISRKTLHLSLQKLDSSHFEALKNCKQLRTLLFLGECVPSINQLPRDLFLCLKSLRTLDLSGTLVSGLPSSIGCLELLHYLDFSYTPIRILPRSIETLYSLQTLKLRDCFALCSLPPGMRNLTSLRHLDFDIVRQLNFIPKGMGSLTNLQTLKAFLVGREEGCSVAELKDLDNITGTFCIARLENVANVVEAKKAALNSKQYITKLELRWGEHRYQNSKAEEQILEYLQPHTNLESLQILFYNGSLLPSWISNPSFTNLASITLCNCKNCYLLPSMGELPSLSILKIVGMAGLRDINRLFCRNYRSQGLKAFPKLEKLTLENMLNLEEWTGMENGDFPCLLQMSIICCPKLYDLPLLSHFKALKKLEISYCAALQSLHAEHQLPPSLQSLILRDCPKVTERCRKDGGEDWFKIVHVPNIWIDDEEISLN